MVKDFVKSYAKLLASKPEDIEVEQHMVNPDVAEVTIYANRADLGKLIGKDGKMIGSIKTLISGCKAKDSISYKVSVKITDE